MIQISTLKIKVKSAALEPFAASTLQPHSQSFGQSFENELRKQQKYRVHITPLTDADAVLDLSKVLCRILTTIRKYSIGRAALQTNNKSIGVDTRVRIGADAALDSLEPLCRIHIAADANSSWTILARLGARRKNCRISKLEDIWCQTIETSSSININHYTPRKK